MGEPEANRADQLCCVIPEPFASSFLPSLDAPVRMVVAPSLDDEAIAPLPSRCRCPDLTAFLGRALRRKRTAPIDPDRWRGHGQYRFSPPYRRGRRSAMSTVTRSRSPNTCHDDARAQPGTDRYGPAPAPGRLARSRILAASNAKLRRAYAGDRRARAYRDGGRALRAAVRDARDRRDALAPIPFGTPPSTSPSLAVWGICFPFSPRPISSPSPCR